MISLRRGVRPLRRALQDVGSGSRFAWDTRGCSWGYLGWVARGNLGDDAIFAAHRFSSTRRLAPVPLVRMEAALQIADKFARRPFHDTVLVGGGTVVGRQDWLERLETYLDLVPEIERVVIWGAGVEDPDFPGGYADRASLAGWARLLKRAGPVGVRGPLSQQILHEAGVDALVVGDPALRLFVRSPRERVAGRVLLNGAMPEASYEGSSVAHIELLAGVASTLAKAGHEVVLFSMDPKDERVATEIAALAQGVKVLPYTESVQDVLSHLSSADVVVSQRLHGNILAAAVGVPFVSLDYRPKCADFAASVGMQEFNVRMAGVEAHDLVSLVNRVSTDPTIVQTMRESVSTLIAQQLPTD